MTSSSEADIVNCYCSNDEEDGYMVMCEKCKTWQHGECINMTKWTIPEHYVCPTCAGKIIQCPCEFECDYRRALVCCPECGKYQHKRDVNLSLGPIPTNYICPKCRSRKANYKYAISHVQSFSSFFPDLSHPIHLSNITPKDISIPTGSFSSILDMLTEDCSPLTYITNLFNQFSDVFFFSHPFLNFFDIHKYNPESHIEDSLAFAYYFFLTCSKKVGISTKQVAQVLNHLLFLAIYKRPMSPALRFKPAQYLPQVYLNGKVKQFVFSERAEEELDDLNIPQITMNDLPKLLIAPGPSGTETVITQTPLKEGDLIAELYGRVFVFEEVDHNSTPPDPLLFNIARTDLFVSTSSLKEQGIFMRISRGFVSNCECRLFKIRDEIKVGIFATKPTPMVTWINPEFKFDSRENTYHQEAISPGGELVLPFDMTPTFVDSSVKWALNSQKLKEKQIVDLEDWTPPTPSPIVQRKFGRLHNQEELGPMAHFLGDSSMMDNIFGNETIMTFTITTDRKYEKMSDLPNSKLPPHLSHYPIFGKKGWQPPVANDHPIEVPTFKTDLTVFDVPIQTPLKKPVKSKAKLIEDVSPLSFFELDDSDFDDITNDNITS